MFRHKPGQPDNEEAKARETNRRSRDLGRKLDDSKSARDIAPIPAVADPDQRAQCADSLRLFLETYFPDAFALEWSDDHLNVIARMDAAVRQGGLFAFAMPRGSGKTTICLRACCWAILYGHCQYVCLIGSASGHAEQMLASLQSVLMSNNRLYADFPEALHPIRALENNARRQRGQICNGKQTNMTWAADRLVMPTIDGDQLPENLNANPSSGALVTVAGLDSNIRGQQHTRPDGTVVRPDLVILDDPQTRQSAGSLTQTRHRLSILNGDVLGLAGPGTRIAGFMTCTKIYADDLADQVLNREQCPEWQGICTKMVYAWPENQTLWDQYATLRADGLRAGDGGKAATDFYAANRTEMDRGAKVAWPARHDPDELSALQHAMNLKLRDEAAFAAEYQNEPATETADAIIVSVQDVMNRTNDRPRAQAPKSAIYLTAFIDVHDKMLYWLVAAWAEDFTGAVIDYGTWPDQPRKTFTMKQAQRTLRRKYQGAGVEGAVLAGLNELGPALIEKRFDVAGGGKLSIERLLVDAGYLPGVVGDACRHIGPVAMPAKGLGITAGRKPMSSYRRRQGEKHGHHWYIPATARTAEVRHVLIDTNYWKTAAHQRLATAPGDPGALTLFGKSPSDHRLIAEHIAASETAQATEGQGRKLVEWHPKPAKPDNHWFDCLTGAMVAASMLGAKSGDEAQPSRKREKVKLSKLRSDP